LIQRTLMRFQGNRRKTAAFLNISERTLYRRLKMLGSAPPNT
jgi:DNA-binding NtrC family response regulator